MARRLREADRLARHNAEMRLALAENLSLADARWRLFEKRQAEADLARTTRHHNSRRSLCGTEAAARPTYWWERD